MVGSGLVLGAGTHQELSDLLVADSEEARKTQAARTQELRCPRPRAR